MKRTVLCATAILALACALRAGSTLHIEDVGLHGYVGSPSPVTVLLRNPSAQPQRIHLEIGAEDADPHRYTFRSTVTREVTLTGSEQRRLEVPILLRPEKLRITADASAGNSSFAHDQYEGVPKQGKLVAILCANDEVCKAAQSQIQFSGSSEARDEKNRRLVFEVVKDARDDWWAYSAADMVVLGVPMAQLTPAQRDALEGYLRGGGRLIVLEDEIADTAFLSAYRNSSLQPKDQRVGKGTLFLVSGLKANILGDIFSGHNLSEILQPNGGPWMTENAWSPLSRFATAFSFPRLRWLLLWLAVYIVVIGVLNFTVLRRLKRLNLGWISVCGVALLFAAGFYFSSSSKRPKEFRLDNLDAYFLDSRSSLAAADYQLRVSAPERRDVMVSVADPAVFVAPNYGRNPANSQIWTEMNGEGPPSGMEYDIRVGPPSEMELTLLKWSFRDLNYRGLRQFPGTVHFVAPNRLRNDTGQHFDEAVYIDHNANSIYSLPALASGQEIQLDTLTPKPLNAQEQPWDARAQDQRQHSLESLVRRYLLPNAGKGRVFAGIGDGPPLPADLNLPHQQNVHTLVVVNMEQP